MEVLNASKNWGFQKFRKIEQFKSQLELDRIKIEELIKTPWSYIEREDRLKIVEFLVCNSFLIKMVVIDYHYCSPSTKTSSLNPPIQLKNGSLRVRFKKKERLLEVLQYFHKPKHKELFSYVMKTFSIDDIVDVSYFYDKDHYSVVFNVNII